MAIQGGIIHTWSEPQLVGHGAAMSYTLFLMLPPQAASEISVEQRVKSQDSLGRTSVGRSDPVIDGER